MLAFRDDDLAALVIVMATGVAITAGSLWYKHRQARLNLISKALESDQIDEESRRLLADELRGGNGSHWQQNLLSQARLISRNFVFVLGWVGMFVGIGLMATGAWDLFEAGVIATCAGFGVATIPLALRELQGRAS